MTALRIVTVILCLLVLPAMVALVGTAKGYLDTAADISALRIEVVGIRPIVDPARPLAGPEIDLRVYGVAQSSLRFAEVNFDLLWQGKRAIVVSTFPNLSIPRNGSLAVPVQSNLEPDRAAETKALLAAGERRFIIEGNARIGLPNSDASVWLILAGPVSVAVSVDGGRWAADGAPRDFSGVRRPTTIRRGGV